jgi:chromosome segregation ATPase
MQIWNIIFKVIIVIIGIVLIAFNVLLYTFCERQKTELNSMRDKQDVEAEFNSNKFKYQADQIERLDKNLEEVHGQMKSQNDALLQEIEKRQQVEIDGKSIQTSLVDIKAEADAMKQDMKGWQKDYVSVLAGLEKKMDDSQYEIKSFENNLTALNIPALKTSINSLKADIEKMTPTADNSVSSTVPVPDTNADHTQLQSQ